MTDPTTEYGTHHVFNPNTWHTFNTITQAIEWLTEQPEPRDWRIYEREITAWKEVE